MENAGAQTLRSTSTIGADAYLFVETAGATLQKRISNGEKTAIRITYVCFFS